MLCQKKKRRAKKVLAKKEEAGAGTTRIPGKGRIRSSSVREIKKTQKETIRLDKWFPCEGGRLRGWPRNTEIRVSVFCFGCGKGGRTAVIPIPPSPSPEIKREDQFLLYLQTPAFYIIRNFRPPSALSLSPRPYWWPDYKSAFGNSDSPRRNISNNTYHTFKEVESSRE